jgi:signal transduction histidine kinase
MESKAIDRVFIPFVICIAFFPFVSPYPIEHDLQPTFFAFAAIAIVAKKRHVNILPIVVLGPITVLSAIYFSDFVNWNANEFLRFLFAILSFLFFINYSHWITQRLLVFVTLLHGVMVLWHFLFPSAFVELFEPFVRVIKMEEIGYRGASGLAPEAGFAGIISATIVSLSTFRKDSFGEGKWHKLIITVSVVTIILTRSGSGYFYLGLFSLMYFCTPRRMWAVLLIGPIVALVVTNADVGRGSAAVNFVQSPIETVQTDGSIGERALNVTVGVLSIIEAPFGFGFDNYVGRASEISEKYKLSDDFKGDITMVSAFSRYSVMAGAVWWFTLVVTIGVPILFGGFRIVPYMVMAGVLLGVSLSVAFPLTWAVIGLAWRNVSTSHGHLRCRLV